MSSHKTQVLLIILGPETCHMKEVNLMFGESHSENLPSLCCVIMWLKGWARYLESLSKGAKISHTD